MEQKVRNLFVLMNQIPILLVTLGLVLLPLALVYVIVMKLLGFWWCSTCERRFSFKVSRHTEIFGYGDTIFHYCDECYRSESHEPKDTAEAD